MTTSTSKSILKILAMTIATAFIYGFTSYGDDDNDSSKSKQGQINRGNITANTYIKSAGNFDFAYNDNMTISSIIDNEENEKFKFSYNPLKIVAILEDDEDYYIYTVISNISLNSKGFITAYDYQETRSNNERLSKGKVKLSYDSNDHLVSISESCDVKDTFDDYVENYSSASNTKLTWNNGRLTTVSFSEKETSTDSGNPLKTYGAQTATFSYDNTTPNKVEQWTPILEGEYIFGTLPALFYVGYYGKAGNYHPTGVEVKVEDGENNYSLNYSTGLNSDGTVAYFTAGDKRKAFTYITKTQPASYQNSLERPGSILLKRLGFCNARP